MKIRIKGNSVRYRLTKTEVETFCKTGYYSEKTEFNSSIFNYALVSKEGLRDLTADFADGSITIFFPSDERETWAYSAKVGYENNINLNNGKTLSLLVEKDFVCLDDRDEDESDNYPNPRAGYDGTAKE